ncbi:hypothetical protein PbJCM13498_35760 [Prolixibacter bellariivorans]|uniref:Uncharacterized protein n=1 Tax=Prolixibacter bellariivorans TaxID=314319 RepID=A0A5M4B4E3_9BACT|nr:hypothetical protein PbJCM13498_35760 [Prolixibacter bellariivorans]
MGENPSIPATTTGKIRIKRMDENNCMYQRFLFIIGTKAGPFKRTKDNIFNGIQNGEWEKG